MLDQDFELIICVRTCDKKSTLGSVAPLAMVHYIVDMTRGLAVTPLSPN